MCDPATGEILEDESGKIVKVNGLSLFMANAWKTLSTNDCLKDMQLLNFDIIEFLISRLQWLK